MTLQEKIDKLPLSIIFGQRLYTLSIVLRSEIVRIIYRCNQPIARNVIMDITNYNPRKSLSQLNGEYAQHTRVGCIVCPKANLSHNYKALIRYPKLIDAFIRAKEKSPVCDWIITSDNKDYSDDKVYYICRWLNHSFRPFSKRQEREYQLVKEAYLNKKNNSIN